MNSILHRDGAMMKPCKFFRNAKAQSEVFFICPCGVGPVEPVKNIRFMFVGNSAALVRYRKDQGLIFMVSRGAHCDGPAGGSIIFRIVKKNHEKLAESLGIPAYDRQRFFGKFQAKGDPLFFTYRAKEFKKVDKEGVHINFFPVHAPGFGIGGGQKEHIIYQPRHAAALLVDERKESVCVRGGGVHSMGGGFQDRKGRAQFMGRSGNKTGLFFLLSSTGFKDHPTKYQLMSHRPPIPRTLKTHT